MPYSKITDLPPEVRENLTEDEQRIWLEVWNSVYAQTHDEQKAFQAAWGAVKKDHVKALLGLKSADDGGVLVAGWGMLFSDGSDPDLHRQFFTEATETLADLYDHAPLFYEHGRDPVYGSRPIGRRESLEVYPHGIWVEHRLFSDHPQYMRTVQEVRDGLLSYSGDTFLHLIQNDFNAQTGELGFWPAAGWSLVRNPAEPGLGPVSIKVITAAVKSARHTTVASRRDASGGGIAAKARDAHDAAVQRDTGIGRNGDRTMDQLLELLAQFFGVEPTPDAIKPLLDEFIAWLSDQENAPASAAERFGGMDAGAIKDAFGLPPDADNAALVEKLNNLKSMLFAATPNYGLLKQVAAMADAAKSSDATDDDPIPHQVSGVSVSGSLGAKAVRRSLYVNRGAEPPGLSDLIVGILSDDKRKIASATKSAGVEQSVTGGYIARREISDKLIEPLLAQEVVMAAGAQVEQMDGIETLSVYKDLSNIQAYWAGEHQAVGQSTPKFGVVHLSLRELVAEVRVSARLLKSNSVGLEERLRSQMGSKMRLRMDKSFLLGEGVKPSETGNSGTEPLGILNIPGVGTKTLAADGKYPQFPADLASATKALKAANVEPSETWAWIVHPSLAEDLNDQTDTSGQPLMRENWSGKARPTWRSYPYYETSQIPTNLTVGSNSDNSLIFFGDWQYCVVGLGSDVRIAVNDSVYFRERDVLIQAVALVDFGVFYPQAFYVLKGARVRA